MKYITLLKNFEKRARESETKAANTILVEAKATTAKNLFVSYYIGLFYGHNTNW